MEVVPEIVFLSCCHLGSVNNPHSQPNKLAYSLSRKLIEMGVRCVVAAGWAVNDDAACTFASTFFDELTGGETFGEAIFAARKAAFNQHPGSNTWGAYQAYGDPGYRLQANAAYHRTRKTHPFVAVDELLATINGHQVKNKRRKSDAKPPTIAQQMLWVQRQLARCPRNGRIAPRYCRPLRRCTRNRATRALTPRGKPTSAPFNSKTRPAGLPSRRSNSLPTWKRVTAGSWPTEANSTRQQH